jgi:glucan biosynthesis protein
MAMPKPDSGAMRHRTRPLVFNGSHTALLLYLALSAPAKAEVRRADIDLTCVTKLAEQRARSLFHSPREDLPGVLRQENLDYDKYRQTRFRPDQAFWAGDKLPFPVGVFSPRLHLSGAGADI